MGLLYLDATRNWSDPASTDLLYLREDRTWAKPDTDHRFLDATNGYSVPELAVPHHVTIDTSHQVNSHITVWSPDGGVGGGVPDYAQGETVSLMVDDRGLTSSTSDSVGWLPTSQPYTYGSLRDHKRGGGVYGTYTFTMPDEDVTVYAVCLGGGHAKQ